MELAGVGGLRRRRRWQRRLTAPENGRSGDDSGEGGRPWRDADCGGAGKRKGEGRRRRWSGQWSESEGNREEAAVLGNRDGGRRISAEEMEAAVDGGRGRVTGEGRQSADGGGVGEGGDGGWGGEIRKWRWRSATQAVVDGDREVNGGEGAVMGSRRRKRRKGEGAEEKRRRSARLRWRRQGAERKRQQGRGWPQELENGKRRRRRWQREREIGAEIDGGRSGERWRVVLDGDEEDEEGEEDGWDGDEKERCRGGGGRKPVLALDGDTGEDGEEGTAVTEGLGGEEGKKTTGSARSRCHAPACVERDGVLAGVARRMPSRTRVALSGPLSPPLIDFSYYNPNGPQ